MTSKKGISFTSGIIIALVAGIMIMMFVIPLIPSFIGTGTEKIKEYGYEFGETVKISDDDFYNFKKFTQLGPDKSELTLNFLAVEKETERPHGFSELDVQKLNEDSRSKLLSGFDFEKPKKLYILFLVEDSRDGSKAWAGSSTNRKRAHVIISEVINYFSEFSESNAFVSAYTFKSIGKSKTNGGILKATDDVGSVEELIVGGWESDFSNLQGKADFQARGQSTKNTVLTAVMLAARELANIKEKNSAKAIVLISLTGDGITATCTAGCLTSELVKDSLAELDIDLFAIDFTGYLGKNSNVEVLTKGKSAIYGKRYYTFDEIRKDTAKQNLRYDLLSIFHRTKLSFFVTEQKEKVEEHRIELTLSDSQNRRVKMSCITENEKTPEIENEIREAYGVVWACPVY